MQKQYNVYLSLYARGLPICGNLGYGQNIITAESREQAIDIFNTQYHHEVVKDLVKPVFFLSTKKDETYVAVPQRMFQQHIWDIHITADEVVH